MGQGNRFSGGKSGGSGLDTRGGRTILQKEINDIINKDPLLKDLVKSGAKITIKDVVFTAKDKSGQVVWLEKGNEKSGLTHIQKHTNDFVAKHRIQQNRLVGHLKNVIKKGKVVSVTAKPLSNGLKGLEKVYVYKGKYYTVSAVGTNGYIVTMYPIDGGK